MALVKMAIGRLVLRDEGQDLMEYGLLAALIAVFAMVSVAALGETIYTLFWRTIGSSL
jgi:Flp pilus assembly pilin Flp